MQLKYKCSICGELHKNLENHIKKEHKEKRFKCLICNQTTNFLIKHLKNVHNISEKEYYDTYILNNNIPKCLYCDAEPVFNTIKTGYFKVCKKDRGKYRISKVIETLKKKYKISDDIEITNVSQIKEIQDIIQQNNIKNYGVKNTFLIKDKDGIEKRIKTCQKNLNCDYPTQNTKVKEKIVKVVNEKYGCDNVMQNHEIRKRNQQKILFNDIYFDSQMEVDFYTKLKELNIPFIYQPETNYESFVYTDSRGKSHKYEPDFKIGKTYIELKGLHFFKDGNPENEMINPYNRTDSPDEVAYRDNIMESKHQCMIKNNVVIITDLNTIDYEILRGYVC